MATLALELHDAGLVALRAGDAALAAPPSPGFALLDGERLRLGEEARRAARRLPRHVHHRFWRELDLAPLGRPFPRRWRSADLAHAHLAEVWAAVRTGVHEVVLAVPGPFDDRRLGLLLGLARALDLPLRGLVDSALAAGTAADPTPGRRLHLDLHLHRAVLAELVHGRHDLVRRRVAVEEGVGLVALGDAWARRVAELFVAKTRYDPLHAAGVEQELYDRSPAWLAALAVEEVVTATLAADGRERSVELRREDARAVVAPCRERLLALVRSLADGGDGAPLLLGHHLAAVPLLAAGLAEVAGGAALSLPLEAAVRGALAARDAIVGDGPAADGSLVFVVRLPARGGERGEG